MTQKKTTADEKIKVFKRLYTDAYTLILAFEQEVAKTGKTLEEKVDQAIANMDEMISMLPMKFSYIQEGKIKKEMLLINVNDPEDEPEQIANSSVPDHVHMLFEKSAHMTLENWKFRLWSKVNYLSKELAVLAKYKPLLLAHAKKSMDTFPFSVFWVEWERQFFLQCANKIGWHAFLEEDDPGKQEEALAILEKGFVHSNWYQFNYLKDTKARLLLKMGRVDEAYAIVKEGLRHNANHADFQDLKTDEKYLQWLQKAEDREAAAKKKEETDYQAFLLFVKEEQAKQTNQFVNPAHPLVKEHAAVLNQIKQEMLWIKLRTQYKDSKWQTPSSKYDQKFVDLKKWSVKEVETFEKEHAIRLPDQFKVYLMEIGEGGDPYYCWSGVTIPTEEEIDAIRKPFPITADKMHPINHSWAINAWVEPDDKDWKKLKILPKTADMQAMFGFPEGVTANDGCWYFGDSYGQDPLYLIMNGEFEGEVWVDTLQYGAEACGCFAQATPQKLHFLPFLAESLRHKSAGYSSNSYTGSWL